MRPILMPPNRLDHFYLGGSRITDLRGVAATSDRSPEEWLGSTVTRFGEERLGLSSLPAGSLLRDAVDADPDAWLGAAHTTAFGTSTGILVKLLDAGQRLPVHLHPDRAFSRRHLDCPYGKTEAWYVLEADEGAVCHLGFREELGSGELARLVADQDTEALLAAMQTIEVRPGDGILVPSGLPHATGQGILVVEAQEPTDLSILLDWSGLPLDGEVDGHLDLGFPTALSAVDRSGWSPERLASLVTRTPDPARIDALLPLLPAASEPFFRVHLAHPATALEIEPGFAVVVVLAGVGTIDSSQGGFIASRGDVLVVPYAAGAWQVGAGLTAVVCRPGTDGPLRSGAAA